MKAARQKITLLSVLILAWISDPGSAPGQAEFPAPAAEAGALLIGWATTNLTPDRPVILAGQMHARVSEGIGDPVTATALVLESKSGKGSSELAVMVSCDLINIADEFRDAVREKVRAAVPGLDAGMIVLNATHTHTAPAVRADRWHGLGVSLDAMPVEEYSALAAQRIAAAVAQAWKERAPGGISYALGNAVVGHNRLVSRYGAASVMYGKTDDPAFSHIEGYEDHSVNLLATWDPDRRLTGLIVNVACPSQVSEREFQISADYWHETRQELRRRFGAALFVLPQCSAAGDQSPRPMLDKAAEERMLTMAGQSLRQAIAVRIADATATAWPVLQQAVVTAPVLKHRTEILALPRRHLADSDLREASDEALRWRATYDKLRAGLEAEPQRRKAPRWYVPVTEVHGRARWNEQVAARRELQKKEPDVNIEVHVVRLGDVVFATNPFEYYLDYGCQIKARSRAVQTFVVQLAGAGTYLPTARAVAGKSYGAVPASTIVGPEGGRQLAQRTVAIIAELMPVKRPDKR